MPKEQSILGEYSSVDLRGRFNSWFPVPFPRMPKILVNFLAPLSPCISTFKGKMPIVMFRSFEEKTKWEIPER